METEIPLSRCEWREMVEEWQEEKKRKKGVGEKVGLGGVGWGEEGRKWGRQAEAWCPTYNREHERAQKVPQRGPGDGRDRRHLALEPRQPTLTHWPRTPTRPHFVSTATVELKPPQPLRNHQGPYAPGKRLSDAKMQIFFCTHRAWREYAYKIRKVNEVRGFFCRAEVDGQWSRLHPQVQMSWWWLD